MKLVERMSTQPCAEEEGENGAGQHADLEMVAEGRSYHDVGEVPCGIGGM
jgi:hypothetical protein